jgi:26S proteasome regulatory subunit T2
VDANKIYILLCPPNQEERAKVDELRGTPMGVGTLEEMIDDNHAIVSSSVGADNHLWISPLLV